MSTLLDANLLIYAFREDFPEHQTAHGWLTKKIASERVGLPLLSEMAFLRLSTKPLGHLSAAPWSDAWGFITALLANSNVRRVQPGVRHPEIFHGLVEDYNLAGNAIVDAWLAALAIDQGATLASADKGFARFSELRWVNPISPEAERRG